MVIRLSIVSVVVYFKGIAFGGDSFQGSNPVKVLLSFKGRSESPTVCLKSMRSSRSILLS